MAVDCSNEGGVLLFGVSERPFIAGTSHKTVLSCISDRYCFLWMIGDMLQRADSVLVPLLSD